MPPHLRFDSADLPAEEQAAAHRVLHPAHEIEIGAPERGFAARVETWTLGAIALVVMEMDEAIFTRSPRLIAADGIDAYAILFSREGCWRGEFDGVAGSGGPGEALVYDLGRPNRVHAMRSRTVTLMLARDRLDEALPPFDLHGLVLREGPGGLICDHLEALAQRMPGVRTRDAPAVIRATFNLVAACLEPYRAERAGSTDPTPLLPRAKRYIAAHLDGDLGVERLCSALGVSRTTLYRAFEPLGGVAAWVLQKRLQRIHTLLQRPGENRTLSELAYAYGFVSRDHFSRRFRAEYGCTASALRRDAEARLAESRPPTVVGRYPRLR